MDNKAIFKTARLFIHEQGHENNKKLWEIISDEETMRFYPRPYTLEETAGWITRSLKSYAENNVGMWALYLKGNREYIGQCGITMQKIDGDIVPEVGYHINKLYWKQGYATEAAEACLKYGFDTLKFDEIYIHTYVKNLPSIRVAEKLGMVKRKEYLKIVGVDKFPMQHVVFSLKREEYKEN